MLEWQRVVVGVERGLVPLVGEALGELVRGVAPVLVPGVRIAAEVMVVVPALEVRVHLDHPVDVVAHVRLEHLGRDRGMVRHADGLARGVSFMDRLVKYQWWSSSPPMPSGWARLWSWPATNPSSEID